jgi:hypothetical protein
MEFIMAIVFLLGYLAITLEHNLHVDKAAPALLVGMLSWGLYAIFPGDALHVDVNAPLTEIAQE